jgi:hypothetical protein
VTLIEVGGTKDCGCQVIVAVGGGGSDMVVKSTIPAPAAPSVSAACTRQKRGVQLEERCNGSGRGYLVRGERDQQRKGGKGGDSGG